jgi:hypothetical protein
MHQMPPLLEGFTIPDLCRGVRQAIGVGGRKRGQQGASLVWTLGTPRGTEQGIGEARTTGDDIHWRGWSRLGRGQRLECDTWWRR